MKIFKEILVAIIAIAIIVVVSAIVLYSKMANQKSSPTVTKYKKNTEVTEIVKNDINTSTEEDGLKPELVIYKIDEEQINELSGSRGFGSGRSNPFDEVKNGDAIISSKTTERESKSSFTKNPTVEGNSERKNSANILENKKESGKKNENTPEPVFNKKGGGK